MSELDHIDEDVAASALGALTPDEQAAIDRHTAICPACHHLLAQARDTAHLLAWAVSPVSVPDQAKTRLLATIDRDQFLQRPTPRPQRALPIWATWVATGVALLMIMWNVKMQFDMSTLRTENSMIANDVQPSVLKPQGVVASTVEARMYMQPDGSQAMLVIKNLDPAPSGKVYMIWLANDTTKQPVQSFQPSHHLEQVMLRASDSIKKYKWVMITIEDANGTPVPSQQPVLLGNL